MNCPYCQTPLVPGATFCAACGNNVSAFTQANQQTTPAQPSEPQQLQQQPWPTPAPYPYPLGQAPQSSIPGVGAPLSQPFASGAYAPPMDASGMYGMPIQPSGGYGVPAQSSGGYGVPVAQGYPPQGSPAMGNGGQFIARLFGPNAVPQMAQPYTRLQRFFMKNVSPAFAVNMWGMAALGAVVAIAGALLLTLGTLFLWSSMLDAALSSLGSSSLGSLISGGTKNLLTPSVFQLFALEQHAPLDIALTASASDTGSLNGAFDIGFPLTGLLLAPALALLLGGYVAAASDFQRSVSHSMLRGALIAPFYAVLAAIVALLATVNTTSDIVLATVTVTITVSFIQTFFYALLWGIIFGALGGWLHYSGANFISWAQAALQRQSRAKLVGALAGGVATYSIGFLLSLAVVVGVLVYEFVASAGAVSNSSTTTSTVPTSAGITSQLGTIGTVLIVIIVLAPMLAVWLFSFATGAPITTSTSSSALAATGGSTSGSTSFGLLGSSSTLAGQVAPSVPHYAYVLVLIPLITYLAGGRIAARVARATTPGEGFIAGALMAIPLSLITTFFAACSGVFYSISFASLASASESVGPNVLQVFLATLIAGAIVGGLGGMSLFSVPQLGALPRLLALPGRPLGLALAPLFDQLTRRPTIAPRSQSREWLYDGVAIGLTLAIVVIALDVLSIASASLIPFKTLVTIEGVVAAIMVALPLAFFIGSLTAAFSTPAATVAPIPLPVFPPALPAPQVMAGFASAGFPIAGAQPLIPMNPMQSGAFMPPPPSMPSGVMAQPMQPLYPGYPGYTGAPSGGMPALPGVPVTPDAATTPGAVWGAPPAAILPMSPDDTPTAPPRGQQPMPPSGQPDADR